MYAYLHVHVYAQIFQRIPYVIVITQSRALYGMRGKVEMANIARGAKPIFKVNTIDTNLQRVVMYMKLQCVQL